MSKRWHLSEQLNEGFRVLRRTNEVLLSLSLVRLKEEGETLLYDDKGIHRGIEDGVRLVRGLYELVKAMADNSGELEGCPVRVRILAKRLVDSRLGNVNALLEELDTTLVALSSILEGAGGDIDQAWQVISTVHELAQDQIESSKELMLLA